MNSQATTDISSHNSISSAVKIFIGSLFGALVTYGVHKFLDGYFAWHMDICLFEPYPMGDGNAAPFYGLNSAQKNRVETWINHLIQDQNTSAVIREDLTNKQLNGICNRVVMAAIGKQSRVTRIRLKSNIPNDVEHLDDHIEAIHVQPAWEKTTFKVGNDRDTGWLDFEEEMKVYYHVFSAKELKLEVGKPIPNVFNTKKRNGKQKTYSRQEDVINYMICQTEAQKEVAPSSIIAKYNEELEGGRRTEQARMESAEASKTIQEKLYKNNQQPKSFLKKIFTQSSNAAKERAYEPTWIDVAKIERVKRAERAEDQEGRQHFLSSVQLLCRWAIRCGYLYKFFCVSAIASGIMWVKNKR